MRPVVVVILWGVHFGLGSAAVPQSLFLPSPSSQAVFLGRQLQLPGPFLTFCTFSLPCALLPASLTGSDLEGCL